MYRDDGSLYKDKKPRWNRIQNFKRLDSFTIQTKDHDSSNRVSKIKIFDFYGYSGIPRAEYFRSRFIYSIACIKKCPDKFELLAENLVNVDGLPINFGKQKYQQKKQASYSALDKIQ